MIVADTDVLVDALHGQPPGLDAVSRRLESGMLATTAVSVFELLSGARNPRVHTQIERLLAAVPIYPLDDAAGRAAADIRRQLDTSGSPIGMADYLIAGICVARSASLLTRNRRHFERVAGLDVVEP